ncbi:MAG: segregation/condensation protein A [Clostridiales bacterium]|jgi:segregation and condensation protein A|nr:segregation/condensation protein A [Clostridiales bacterium]
MPDLVLRLQAFEGPIDLLFKLIEKNKVNLFDIPVAEIAEQYVEIIKQFPEDMEFMSGYLLMAATLLEIKSRLLVPRTAAEEGEEEEDPREALVARLLDYKRFKEVTETFRDLEKTGEKSWFRAAEKDLLGDLKGGALPDLEKILRGLDADRLKAIYLDTLSRREAKTDKARAGFKGVAKDAYNIEEKLAILQSLLETRKRLDFTSLFRACREKSERVVMFLALLEMTKKKNVAILQSDVFEDIFICSLDQEPEE